MNTERTHTSNVLAFPNHTDYAGCVQGPYTPRATWKGFVLGLVISLGSVALSVWWFA